MTTESSFVRVLGRRDVLTLAFGAMVGWSWIVLTAEWIGRAGWLGAAAAFVIGGMAMIFIGLTYAELAAAMPEAVANMSTACVPWVRDGHLSVPGRCCLPMCRWRHSRRLPCPLQFHIWCPVSGSFRFGP